MDEAYGERLADVYDLFYTVGKKKDYAAEVAAVAAVVKQRFPLAASVLDVGCGTGEHLRYLRGFYPDAEGVELSDPMRAKAIAKLPDVPIHAGDMRDFELGRTFDVVVCLFSAIGYTRSAEEMAAAIKAMACHLEPGGLLVLDPWFHPGGWAGGYLDHTVVIADDRKILRLAQSTLDGRTSRVTYHYLVGDSNGIDHFTDEHVMTLFTRHEYGEAIRAAGCGLVEFVAGCSAGRDRIVAVKE